MTRSWRLWLLQHEFESGTAPANKATRTERNRSVVSSNIIDGLTVMMSNAHTGGSLYAHTWITWSSLSHLYVDDPGGRTNLVYNKLLEQQTDSATRYLQGEIMGAVRGLVLRRYPSRLCEVCNRWKWWCFLSSYLSVYRVNKMILKYQSGRKHELTEHYMMKRALKGKNCEIQQI